MSACGHKMLCFLLMTLTIPPSLCYGQEAEPPAESAESRHTVRLGWGDMFFETMAFSPTLSTTWRNPSSLPPTYRHHETYDHAYTGHIFAEYLYRHSRVVSFGGQIDLEGIFWKEGTFDRNHDLVSPALNLRNWDLDLLATIRFTYFHRPTVRLYSGVGAGVLLAFDNQGGFELSPALNLNWFGIEVGKKHWGGTAELGMLNALSDVLRVYQLGSRLLSISVYYKW